jgi:hypothetical protein
MRGLHTGAQRHLHEVRYVRLNDGVFVTSTCEGVTRCDVKFIIRYPLITDGKLRLAAVMAGLDPAIHDFKGRPKGRPYLL